MKYERLPKSNEDDCAGADPAFDPLDDGRLLSLVQRVWSNKHRSTITQAVLPASEISEPQKPNSETFRARIFFRNRYDEIF